MSRRLGYTLLSVATVLFTLLITLSFAALPSWLAGFIVEPLLRLGGREPSMATGVLLGGFLGAAITPLVQRGIRELRARHPQLPIPNPDGETSLSGERRGD